MPCTEAAHLFLTCLLASASSLLSMHISLPLPKAPMPMITQKQAEVSLLPPPVEILHLNPSLAPRAASPCSPSLAWTHASAAVLTLLLVGDLVLPLLVLLLVIPAWWPYHVVYYDDGSCDESFYDRWSEYCIARQRHRQEVAGLRRTWRNRWRNAMRRWRFKRHKLACGSCSIPFRRRTSSACAARLLQSMLRRVKRQAPCASRCHMLTFESARRLAVSMVEQPHRGCAPVTSCTRRD